MLVNPQFPTDSSEFLFELFAYFVFIKKLSPFLKRNDEDILWKL